MELKDILKLIQGEVFTPVYDDLLEKEFTSAFACDLMSDCLAFVNDNCMLITGLNNLQSLRTAELLDISCIIFVRGKNPSTDLLNYAKDHQIILISTRFTMYETSGLLYQSGIKSLKI